MRNCLKNEADEHGEDNQPIHGNNEYVDVPRNILWTAPFPYNGHTNLTFVGKLRVRKGS